MIELESPLSLRRKCTLLAINRSTLYYEKEGVDIDDATLLNEIRDIWLKHSFWGFRPITKELRHKGILANHKRVQRLMKLGGIQAIFAGPKTSLRNKAHGVYPYLLKELVIDRVNQVWMVDITYLKMSSGFMYLVAIIDVYSRFVVSWSLSNTLDTFNCLTALDRALQVARPEIMNSDQGCQFTSEQWINELIKNGIKISMTGTGRCLDNVYIERFWRSFKQEEFYLNDYEDNHGLKEAIRKYVEFYNTQRWHQALGDKRPAEIYFSNERGLATPVDLSRKAGNMSIDQQVYQPLLFNYYEGQNLLNFMQSLV